MSAINNTSQSKQFACLGRGGEYTICSTNPSVEFCLSIVSVAESTSIDGCDSALRIVRTILSVTLSNLEPEWSHPMMNGATFFSPWRKRDALAMMIQVQCVPILVASRYRFCVINTKSLCLNESNRAASLPFLQRFHRQRLSSFKYARLSSPLVAVDDAYMRASHYLSYAEGNHVAV